MMKFYLLLFIFFSQVTYGENIESVIARAKTTEKLMNSATFSWTAIHGNEAEKHFEVDVYKSPEYSRLEMYFVFEEERRLMSTSFLGKDFWYVKEGEEYGKYRSYEAPYSMPTTYIYLMKSRVQIINATNSKFLGELTKNENGILSFTQKLTREEIGAIRKQIDRINQELLPNAATREEKNFYLRQANKLIEFANSGKVNQVEEKSGIISTLFSADGAVKIKNFKIETISDNEFATPPEGYKDFTDLIDKEQVVFLSHNGNWHNKMNNFQTDGRVVNLTTKKITRIPFRGGVCLPQIFDYQRNLLYVTGISLGSNDVRPFVIDLKTGENLPIGGSYFNNGQTNHLTLTGDGQFLAAIHTPDLSNPLKNNLVIIDNKLKKIKNYPLDLICSKLIWHPNNNSLYLQSFNTEKNLNEIFILQPGGELKKLLNGVDFILLHDQQKLLYLDSVDQLWKTANLDGSGILVVGDGLHKLQFPAYGRSSNEILMIKEDEKSMPVPVLYDFSSKSFLKITDKTGLWLTPVWR